MTSDVPVPTEPEPEPVVTPTKKEIPVVTVQSVVEKDVSATTPSHVFPEVIF